AAQFPPSIGANALVVMNFPCAGLRRGSRQGVATLRTTDEPLHHTGGDGTPTRSYLVVVQQLLGTGKTFLGHQGWHRNLNPLFARALVAGGIARRSYTPPTMGAHLRTCRKAGLAEAGDSAIGGVPQHAPDHRAFPAACPARRNAFAVEPPSDLRDAESLDGIHLIDAPHYTGLGFIDHVGCQRLFRLADIAVAIGSAAHYAHFPGMGTVSLDTPRALQDLGSFVFRDHALELHQELIFRTVALRRLYEQRFHSVAGKLFEQQNLVSVLSAQSVRRVRQHNLDLSFGGQIAHTFQARA